MKKVLVAVLLVSSIASICFSDDMPSEVKRLTNLRDIKIEEVNKEYDLQLNKLKRKYAANGNYKAVAYIENMQAAFSETTPLDESEDESKRATVDCDANFIRMKKGESMIGARYTTAIFQSVPEQFSGRQIMYRGLGRDAAKIPLVFQVKKEGVVTLVASEQGSGPSTKTLLSEGWEEVGDIDISWTPWGEGKSRNLLFLQKLLPVGSYEISSGGDLGVRILQ